MLIGSPNYHGVRTRRCWLVAGTIALFAATAAQAQGLSRDVTASNLDLSGLPEEMHMPLVSDGGVSLGVFRHHAASGVIIMGHDGPLSMDAGMFLGSAEKTYPQIQCTIVKQQGEVDTVTMKAGPLTTYKVEDGACTVSDIWWEGIITGFASILNADGSSKSVVAVVTPRAGRITKIKLGAEEVTATKQDIGDATLKMSDGKTYGVLFQASVRGQMCYLVAQEPATAPTAPTATTKKAVQEAQERLQDLGYQPGSADGVVGAKATAALKKFQGDRGLPVTGQLDQKTLDALSARPAETAKKPKSDGAADSSDSGFVSVKANCTVYHTGYRGIIVAPGVSEPTGTVSRLECNGKDVGIASSEMANGVIVTREYGKVKVHFGSMVATVGAGDFTSTGGRVVPERAIDIAVQKSKVDSFFKEADGPMTANDAPRVGGPPAPTRFAVLHCDEIVGEEVRLRIILVNSKPEADMVIEKLAAGQSFAALATQYSVDAATAGEGGLVGLTPVGDLRKEFQSALKGIAPGGTTGVITVPGQ